MSIEISLDCKSNNQRELLRHQSAALASTKLYHDYLVAKEILFGIEPEMFMEQWIQGNITRCDMNFKNLISIYFIKILQVAQNNV